MSGIFTFINGVSLTKSMGETAYIMDEKENFSVTGYKVLKSQEIDAFVRCETLMYNGKMKLVYFTSLYKSLFSQLEIMKQEELLASIASLIEAVLSIQKNVLLNCKNIDLGLERIFLDLETKKVRLIYLPLNIAYEKKQDDFEAELRKLVNQCISWEGKFSPDWIKYLSGIVNNENLTLETVSEQLFAESKTLEEKALKYEYKHEMVTTKTKILTLALVGEENIATLRIGEQDYLIGKNAAVVDGVLTFNPAISRKHCKVSFHDECFFVMDLGSVNGTYVNLKRIEPQTEVQLRDGDTLALANSKFTVKIEEE